MGVLIREMPLLASALFGPIHAIVCKLIVCNHKGTFLSSIMENTCLQKKDILFAITDMCAAGLIKRGPECKPCDVYWSVCTNIDITTRCPPHLLEELKKRIERTRSREHPRRLYSYEKFRQRSVSNINTHGNIHKKRTKKRLIHRR